MGKGEGPLTADHHQEDLDEEKAAVEVWKYVLGFTEMAVVKCAIELGVADEIESRGGTATLSQLSTALSCSPPSLYRIMRFLVHRGVFKSRPAATREATAYFQTPISRYLLKGGEKSFATLILFESTPTMLAPWLGLSVQVLSDEAAPQPFEAAHGHDIWGYAAQNPEHSRFLDEAMACDARVAAAAVVNSCLEVFEGVGVVVDVGGGNGTFMGMVVKALPRIKAINFDLPHVVSAAPHWDGVEHVGGDMFESIPKADATVLVKVLYDWSDHGCIHILKKCREVVAEDYEEDDDDGNNSGGKQEEQRKIKKVILVEIVMDDDDEKQQDEEEVEKKGWNGVRLSVDMVMMAHTNGGKERTRLEWAHVLNEAGFSSFSIKPTSYFPSVIEAIP